jgi:hypothetical protein
MATDIIPSAAVPSLDDVDIQTADLILQLQLADLADLEERNPGKQKEGNVNDAQMAAELFRENIRSLIAKFDDRRMSQSITAAVRSDGEAISQTVREEETAFQDHNLAHGLSGSRFGTHRESVDAEDQDELSADVLAKLAAIYVSEDVGEEMMRDLVADGNASNEGKEDEVSAEGSAWASARKPQNQSQLFYRCEACHEHQILRRRESSMRPPLLSRLYEDFVHGITH